MFGDDVFPCWTPPKHRFVLVLAQVAIFSTLTWTIRFDIQHSWPFLIKGCLALRCRLVYIMFINGIWRYMINIENRPNKSITVGTYEVSIFGPPSSLVIWIVHYRSMEQVHQVYPRLPDTLCLEVFGPNKTQESKSQQVFGRMIISFLKCVIIIK